MGAWRCAWRLPVLLLLLLVGCLGALLLLPRGPRNDGVGAALLRHWTRWFLRLFGVRVRRVGEPLHDPVMFVANHATWMDISVLHTQRPAGFVAKAEIDHWPLVGWLARRGGTIFHRRGDGHSLTTVMAAMSQRLRAGCSIAVFPEAGVAPAGSLRVFHARILQAALDAPAPVQPVALRYLRNGQPVPELMFAAGENFLHNVVRVLAAPPLLAEVHFLAPVEFDPLGGRRQMAATARSEIARVLGVRA